MPVTSVDRLRGSGNAARAGGRALCGLCLFSLAFSFAGEVAAGDWPSWRGPRGDGKSDAEAAPTRKAVLWTFKDPGLGHSSPIIRGEALFLTTAVDRDRVLLKLDALSGRELWRRTVVTAPLEEKHRKNSYASSTPAASRDAVYVTFLAAASKVLVAAYDFDGRLLWRTSPGEFHSRHGFSSSPLLYRDLVIVNCDQDAPAYIAALDRRTGEERWRIDRENRVRSYCPPLVFDIDGEPQMILSGSKTVTSYDPRTGRRLWYVWGPTEQCVASLVYGAGLVFVTGGYPERRFLAIDPRGRGDVTETHIRWRGRRGVSYVPSPIFHDGVFYVVSDGGVLSALEARTGRYLNQKRLRGDFSASLLYAAGKLYAANEDGELFVLDATPGLRTLAEWSFDAPIYASPAIAGGRLYVRTWETLYALDASAEIADPGPDPRQAPGKRD